MPFGLRKKGNTVPPLYSAPCSQQGRLFPAWINEPFVRRSEPVRTAFVSLLRDQTDPHGKFQDCSRNSKPRESWGTGRQFAHNSVCQILILAARGDCGRKLRVRTRGLDRLLCRAEAALHRGQGLGRGSGGTPLSHAVGLQQR